MKGGVVVAGGCINAGCVHGQSVGGVPEIEKREGSEASISVGKGGNHRSWSEHKVVQGLLHHVGTITEGTLPKVCSRVAPRLGAFDVAFISDHPA